MSMNNTEARRQAFLKFREELMASQSKLSDAESAVKRLRPVVDTLTELVAAFRDGVCSAWQRQGINVGVLRAGR
jgi:hypothetical protein